MSFESYSFKKIFYSRFIIIIRKRILNNFNLFLFFFKELDECYNFVYNSLYIFVINFSCNVSLQSLYKSIKIFLDTIMGIFTKINFFTCKTSKIYQLSIYLFYSFLHLYDSETFFQSLEFQSTELLQIITIESKFRKIGLMTF